MEKNKIENLLHKIIEATNKNRISWQRIEKASFSFKAKITDNTVYVHGGSGGMVFFSFIIFNSNGDEIGKLSSFDFTESDNEIEKLYNLARKNALGIDESLDEMNDFLDSII
ncbi:hypothetical protein [Tenacibaculum sp. 190524A05c]|uniref:Uncharacterized protein n=1 Tax=Tenacibaculum platacis TaxID=3137852 RepID=A0ABM9P604_9FLAO